MIRSLFRLMIAFISFSLILVPGVAKADSVSATLLKIPYIAPSNRPIDPENFLDPAYSVEFDGDLALKYSDCRTLVSEGFKALLQTTWTIKGASATAYNSDMSSSTLAVTKNGIQCAFAAIYRGSSDVLKNLYSFSQNEPNVPITISLTINGVNIGSGTGTYFNPNYMPTVPQILGINRGDTIDAGSTFTLAGAIPVGSNVVKGPTVALCTLQGTLACNVGWAGIDQSGHGYIAGINSAYAGQPAQLVVLWQVKNSSGNNIPVEASVPVTIGNSTTPSDWSLLGPLIKNNYLATHLTCGDLISGKQLTCTINPTVSQNDTSPPFSLNTDITFQVEYQVDDGKRVTAKTITSHYGQQTTFSFTAPANLGHQFSISADAGFTIHDQPLVYNVASAGPVVNIKLPNFITWGKQYRITATASTGQLSSCNFIISNTTVGPVKAVNGVVSTLVSTVWNGTVGSTRYIFYTANCKNGNLSLSGTASVKGFR
jgi:hypothetical protein